MGVRKTATRSTGKRAGTKRSGVTRGATKRPLQDPRGGLTAAGRAAFKRREGTALRPGVKGAADTPEKMRRKGSFLRRHFANPRGPMVDDEGGPTRLALSAHAWGEPVPRTMAAAKKLAAKGERLLERYKATKERGGAKRRPAPRAAAKGASAKRTATKRTATKRTATKRTATKRTATKKGASAKRGTPGQYTKPEMRERLKRRITAGSKGGKSGQWSARKAQLLAAEYEKAGGGYKTGRRTAAQRSLQGWTDEE